MVSKKLLSDHEPRSGVPSEKAAVVAGTKRAARSGCLNARVLISWAESDVTMNRLLDFKSLWTLTKKSSLNK